MKRILFLVLLCFSIFPFSASLLAQRDDSPSAVTIEQQFRKPPDDARIMVRWWWFGPSATRDEIEAEMRQMKSAGIGGFELQAVYPLALDDGAHGFHNYKFLSPEFLAMVKFASHQARELGLRMDLTIGSGWPYGGPYVSPELAATRLRFDSREIAPSEASVPRPVPYQGERLLAAFVARGSLEQTDAASFIELDLTGHGAIALPADGGPRTLLFVFSSPTGQVVKRAAFGAEGYVLDHYNRPAIETHLHEVGDRLLAAAEPGSVYAVFCDSLEVYGANWTADLLQEFKQRRGYDLKPLLPLLEYDAGDRSAKVRRDFGHTLTELYEERFLQPIHAWSQQNKVRFRLQDYGMPPATLSSYREADLFEGEGWPWRTLTATRWASSAAHLFGKPVVSSETWTWIHSPAFRATPLDMKAEADQHFLSGVNQLIGHGWPYSPAQARDPGWSFYAAGVFNARNPWWPVMPDVEMYLQRVSFLLRQGKPVEDVAVYAPTEDAYASFRPGGEKYLDLFEKTRDLIGPSVIPAVLDAGFNFDLIDDGTISAAAGRGYKAIILPNVRWVPEATRVWLAQYAQTGGKVLAVGRKPEGEWPFVELLQQSGLAARLAEGVQPDVVVAPAAPEIGFVHRQLPGLDIYFLANTGNLERGVRCRFRVHAPFAELWDPMSGGVERLEIQDGEIALHFEPYASRVVVFRGDAGSAPVHPVRSAKSSEDLSSGWTVTTGEGGPGKAVRLPYSWEQDDGARYFSGAVTFQRNVEWAAAFREPGVRTFLDFGEAAATQPVPLADGTLRGYSFAALVLPPIREAATVFVNGARAGSLWSPPYRLDITDLLHGGANQVRIEVYNTAINELAEGGRLPDAAALTARYGLRFRLQDMENLRPLPSGILSAVRLVGEK